MTHKSDVVALVYIEWTLQIPLWRLVAWPVPTFLLIHSLQVGHSQVNNDQAHDAKDG
jgi:hypothetical protein